MTDTNSTYLPAEYRTSPTAELILNEDLDLRVVNSARVSMAKRHTKFVYAKHQPKGHDEGLLDYLSREVHWTPFSHSRITLELLNEDGSGFFDPSQLDSKHAAGLVFDASITTGRVTKARHSLYGWVALLQDGFVPTYLVTSILNWLAAEAPNAMKALLNHSVRPHSNWSPLSSLVGGMSSSHVGIVRPEHETDPAFLDVTMMETVPLFTARQRFKHMVGTTYNEESRRYLDEPPIFFIPAEWRKRPAGSIKQGSGATFLRSESIELDQLHRHNVQTAFDTYQRMLKLGVAPELARMELPQSMMVSYYVTASLVEWNRAYRQRSEEHAQKEIQDLALLWDKNLTTAHPHTWPELRSS